MFAKNFVHTELYQHHQSAEQSKGKPRVIKHF